MAVSRFGLEGYGVRRVGSFSGKTPGGSGPPGGAHPVARITRLSLDGYGVRRYGSFAGKTPSGSGPPGGAHPVARITRLSLDGYGVRRYGSFAGKTPAEIIVVIPPIPPTPVVAVEQYGGRRHQLTADQIAKRKAALAAHEAAELRREVDRKTGLRGIVDRRGSPIPQEERQTPLAPELATRFLPGLDALAITKTESDKLKLAREQEEEDLALVLLLLLS